MFFQDRYFWTVWWSGMDWDVICCKRGTCCAILSRWGCVSDAFRKIGAGGGRTRSRVLEGCVSPSWIPPIKSRILIKLVPNRLSFVCTPHLDALRTSGFRQKVSNFFLHRSAKESVETDTIRERYDQKNVKKRRFLKPDVHHLCPVFLRTNLHTRKHARICFLTHFWRLYQWNIWTKRKQY